MSQADANVCLDDVHGWKQPQATRFVSADGLSTFQCQIDSRPGETQTTLIALYLASLMGWTTREVNN